MTEVSGVGIGLAPMIVALLTGGGLAGWWLWGKRRGNSVADAADRAGGAESSTERRVAELERRVVILEDAVGRLREQGDRSALADHREQVYAQAIRMVSRGAGSHELISLCGLSRNEAQLIAMMHGAAETSNA